MAPPSPKPGAISLRHRLAAPSSPEPVKERTSRRRRGSMYSIVGKLSTAANGSRS